METNIVRKIDNYRHLSIPKKLMDKINKNDYMGLFIKDNYFILKNTTKLNANIKITYDNVIIIPEKMLSAINIQRGYKMEFYYQDNNIIIKKHYKKSIINDDQINYLLQQII